MWSAASTIPCPLRCTGRKSGWRRPWRKEHFSIDGSLIEAWTSLKSFRPKDEKGKGETTPDDKGNPSGNFRGEKRSNTTHESTTDPWMKTVGGFRRTRFEGRERTELAAYLVGAAYNFLRIAKLEAA